MSWMHFGIEVFEFRNFEKRHAPCGETISISKQNLAKHLQVTAAKDLVLKLTPRVTRAAASVAENIQPVTVSWSSQAKHWYKFSVNRVKLIDSSVPSAGLSGLSDLSQFDYELALNKSKVSNCIPHTHTLLLTDVCMPTAATYQQMSWMMALHLKTQQMYFLVFSKRGLQMNKILTQHQVSLYWSANIIINTATEMKFITPGKCQLQQPSDNAVQRTGQPENNWWRQSGCQLLPQTASSNCVQLFL